MFILPSTIVGAHFRGGDAKTICAMLVQGDRVELEREPDNRFDANALKAVVNGEHIGYICAADGSAAAIRPYIDGDEDYEGYEVICRVTGHEKVDKPQVLLIAFTSDEAGDIEQAFADYVGQFADAPDAA